MTIQIPLRGLVRSKTHFLSKGALFIGEDFFRADQRGAVAFLEELKLKMPMDRHRIILPRESFKRYF